MCLAAAAEIAAYGEELGLDDDHLVPTMEHEDIFPREAAAVGAKAVEQGLARNNATRDELYTMAQVKIAEARDMITTLMASGGIRPVPEI